MFRFHRHLPALLVLGFAPATGALTINVTFDAGLSAAPAADANGAQLTAIMQAAADYWEDIIEDAGTVNITFYYQNGITGNALMTEVAESGGRFTDALIRFESTPSYGGSSVNRWYYDPSPLNDSEYDIQQVLYRDLSGANQAAMWSGNPPGLIESAFQGPVAAGAPAAAQNAADLWTYALHEIGHALGMSGQLSVCATEISDNDYDISSNFTNGAQCATLVDTGGGAHVECTACLMNTNIGPNNRRIPTAADILSIATCVNPGYTNLDLRRQDFLPAQGGVNTDWNTGGNWVGGAIPGSLDDAAVRIGFQPGVVDGIDIQLSGTAFCRDLLLSEATDIQTNAFKLDVGRNATIEYTGNGTIPQLFVEAGGELEVTTDLLINGGELDMTGGLADVGDDIIISENTNGQMGQLTGFGTVTVGDFLINNGRITATDLDSNVLTFTSTDPTPWDLDGTSGNGEVFATSGNLNFASGAVSDAFDGLMRINDPFTITIAEPWTLGTNGIVDLNGGDPDFATLSGGTITASNGEFECSLNCRVTAPVNFSGSFELLMLSTSELELNGHTTYGGGQFTVGSNALLELNGTSVIQGGTFNLVTDSTLRTDGSSTINAGTFNIGTGADLSLQGAHTLQGGTFTGNGTLNFNGPTTIAQQVTVDCDTLNLDGGGAPGKLVTLNNDLTVNSSALDTGNNTFDSTLNINNIFSQLTINGPPSWTMNGTLNHDSGSEFTFASIAGVPFTMSGTTNVTGGTRWDARTTITGSVNLNGLADTLALGGGTALNPNRIEGGIVNGPGRLRAFQSHLSGFGQIQAEIDFVADTSLLADDGLLTLSGSFLSLPTVIGTADADGTLQIINPWTLYPGNTLDLQGGIVTGASITSGGTVTGSGLITATQVSNNGSISATNGGTLIINTAAAPDLDGTGDAATVLNHTLNAIGGNLTVIDQVTDLFGGTANIGPGRTMQFSGGWTLASTGILNMTGGTTLNPAVLGGSSSTLSGTLNIDDETRIDAVTLFDATSSVNFADLFSWLRLNGDSQVNPGATFSGPGRIANILGSTLTLADGADVGVELRNFGALVIGTSPGTATVSSTVFEGFSILEIELLDRPKTTNWDRLVVPGNADLGGTLNVAFNVAGALPGDTWKIIDAGSTSGSFGSYNVTGLPAGMILVKVEANDGVYLKLAVEQSFADWAANAGLPVGLDGIADDADHDGVENGIEMILNSDSLIPDPRVMPAVTVGNFAGDDFLTLVVPLSTRNVPSGLTASVTRSTDLVLWSEKNVVLEDVSYDPVSCIETRTYRSRFIFGSLPDEYLRIELGP